MCGGSVNGIRNACDVLGSINANTQFFARNLHVFRVSAALRCAGCCKKEKGKKPD